MMPPRRRSASRSAALWGTSPRTRPLVMTRCCARAGGCEAACAASTAFLGEKAGCWAAFTATSLIKRGRRGPRLLAFAAALARRGALRAIPVGMTDAVLGALAASPDDRAAALECLHAFGECKVAGVGDLARQAVRALDAGAAAPAPRPRLEDWRRFGPALLPPRVGPWVGGVEVDVRAAEVAVRAVAAAA